MFKFVITVNNTNGDVMRKFIFSLLIFFSISLIFIPSKQDIKPVFKEQESTYNLYLLDISKEKIDTNNLATYFDNYKILEIYPYINPLYKKIINIKKYDFDTVLSNKKNISNFITMYLNVLDENALNEELVKYDLNGIKINKVRLYASDKEIKDLISKYKISIVK